MELTDDEWDALWKGPTEAEVQATLRERERAATRITQERDASAWRHVDPKGRTCSLPTALVLMDMERVWGGRLP